MPIQRQLTNWECTSSQYRKWGKKETMWSLLTKLSLITQPYRHAHSKATYRLRVHQFTVQQVGKGGNNVIIIDQVITHYTKLNLKNVQTCPFNGNLQAENTASGEMRKQCNHYWPSYHSSHNLTLRMYRLAHSMETYSLRVHQFTVQQVGKGGNNVIIIDQVITHRTKLNPKNVHACPFKGNLPTESAPVHSTASGERRKQCDCYWQVSTCHTKLNPKNVQTFPFNGNLLAESAPVPVQQVGKGGNNVIVIDHVITHHTKLNPKNVQTCPFDGNLLPESAPVHSTASGERRKQCDRYWPSYHSSYKTQP